MFHFIWKWNVGVFISSSTQNWLFVQKTHIQKKTHLKNTFHFKKINFKISFFMYRSINEVTKSIYASNSAKPTCETGDVTSRGFPGSSMVKNGLPMMETQVHSLVGKLPWKKWQPTLVSLPEKSYGQRSLAGYSSWSCSQTQMSNWVATCYWKFFKFKQTCISG